MKYKLLVFVCSFLISGSWATTIGDCEIDDNNELNLDSTTLYEVTINDVEAFTKSFSFTGNVEISLPNTNEDTAYSYTEVAIDDGKLVLQTIPDFTGRFEEDMKKEDPKSTITIRRSVTLICGDAYKGFTFILNVIDTNNNVPTFSPTSYTYKLPSPVSPNIDLTSVGDSIIVTDLDFSNTAISFEVSDSSVFTIEAIQVKSSETQRDYRGVLKVSKFQTLTENVELTVTATDNGNPIQKSEPIKITIEVDSEHSLPSVPSFSHSLYSLVYSTETASLSGDEISISSSNPNGVTVTLTDQSDAPSPYFNAVYDKATGAVTIEPTETKPEISTTPVLVLTLTATLDGKDDQSTKSLVLIQLPTELIVTAPKFSNPYYKATYKVDGDKHTVELSEDIEVSEGANVSLEGDDPHFEIKYVDDKWQPTIKAPLDEADLKIGGDIILTLRATVTSSEETFEGFATLVVELPPVEVIKSPKFTKNIYSATYESNSENGVVTLVGGVTIGAVSEGQTVNIRIASSEPADGTKYFDLTKNGNVWEISVKEKPSDEVLNSGKEYVLELEATIPENDDVEPGYSTLVITVPAPIIPQVPKFGVSYYTAEYQLGDVKDTVEITSDPITIEAEGEVKVEIEPSIYSNYFSINFDSENNNYQVSVDENLPPSVLNEEDDIILTLSATTGDSSEPGVSILVITLPDSTLFSTPIFSETYYEGKYTVNEDGTAVVNLRTPIEITFPLDQEVSINFHEVTDEFELVNGEDTKTWVINVNKTLPVEDYEKQVEIFTLQAIIVGGNDSNVARSSLIIHLPEIPTVPKFVKAFYNAEYNVDNDGTATVTIKDGPIQLSSTDSVTINIVDPYGSSFNFNLDNDPQIAVTKKLDQDIIDENHEILLTLEASIDSSTETEATIVALKLPHVDVQKTLKFNKPSYEISYNVVNDVPTLDYNGQTISIINGDANVNVTVQEPYNSNFKLEINSGDNTYTITILSALEPNILNTETEILLVLEAALEGYEDGFATILLDLPKKDVGIVPKFTESTYTGQYNLGEKNQNGRKDSVDVNLISVEGLTADQVTVTFVENSENFKLVNDESGYRVEVQANLDSKTLLTTPDVVLTLQAKIEGVDEPGKATLVINLPKEVTPITFSQSVYTAKYNNDAIDNPTVDLTDGEIALISNIDATDVTVTLSAPTGYEDNFKIEPNSPYTIAVNNPLKDETLEAGRDLVLTLTASLGTLDLAKATVVVTLPEIPKSPKFTSATYTAKYVETTDNKDEVQLIDKIATDSEDPVSIIVDDPYKEYFNVAYEDNEYKVTVAKNLDLLNIDNPVIYATLRIDDSREPDVATLAIKLPDKTENIVPTFSEVTYFAEYTADNTVTSYSPEIIITSDKAIDTVVQVIGKYSSNFKATPEGTSWILEVIEPLNDNISSEIYVALEATLPLSAGKGTATVIIGLPDRSDLKPAPKFNEPAYGATYSIDENGDYQITDADSIIISSSYDPQVVVTLDEEYTAFFDLKRDENTNKWTLIKKDDLNETILKDNTELIIRLTAHLEGSVEDGLAVLVVKLPKEQIIRFSDPYYEATYQQIEGDNNDKVSLKDGSSKITISEEVSSVQVIGYEDYFEISCPSTECTLTVSKDLTSDILESSTELLLVLDATKDDLTAKATVIIALPLQEKAKAPEFTQNVYTATYDSGVLTVEGIISIQGNPTGVVVTFDEDSLIGDKPATDYFNLVPDGNNWNVTVNSPLPSDIVTKDPAVLINLKATKTDITPFGEAGLVIKLPKTQASTTFYFKQKAYMADYNVISDGAKINLVETITIEGEPTDVEVKVADKEYEKYFDAKLNGDVVTVTTLGVIDGSILANEAAITFNIEAVKGAETDKTVIVVRLPKKVSQTSIYFDETVYMANYDVVNEEPSVDGADNINLQNDNDQLATITLGGDYKDYFDFSRDSKSGYIKLSLNESNALPEEVLTESVITVDVVATIDTETTSTKVVITLPPSTTLNTFDFEDSVYMANYELNEESATLKVDKNITITGTLDNVVVDLTGDNAQYFKLNFDPSTGIVKITVNQSLTSDIVQNEVAITVNIEATKDSEIHKATVVVQLPKKESTAGIQFEETLYMANYTVDDTLQAEDIVILKDEDSAAIITLDGDYKDYFDYTRETNKIKLQLKDNIPLPDEVLSKSVVYVDVVATKGSDTTTTKVVITLPISVVRDTFAFDDTVYMANYELDETNDSPILSPEKPIQITPITGELEGLTITLSGDYKDYFDASFNTSTGQVDVTIANTIESNALESEVAVTINIEASKDSEVHKAAIVVKLPKKVSSTTLYFEKLAYVVEYKVENDKGSIYQKDDIILLGDNDASAEITLSDYTDYFDVKRDEETPDKILVVYKKDLDSGTLDNEAVLSADITATGNETTTTKLLIKLPQKTVFNTSFQFEQTSYMADYALNDDGSVSFTLSDSIKITGDAEEVSVVVEDNDYFTAKYNKDHSVTITSTKALDDSYLKEPVMSINIVASKGNEKTKAVLVIRLPKSRETGGGDGDTDDEGSDTGLIAAVAVLAVLLVASLVGSAVFYYLKFKRTGNFSNSESPRQTFRQNTPASGTKNSFEHPTGVIKYTLEDVDDGFTVTDDEQNIIEKSEGRDIMDKRKSVQFDTINIDEMEIEKTIDDIEENDIGENDYENIIDDEDNDERRSSRV